jgi:trimethylamine--corrinoid protein Co-methyltransferase
VINSNYVSQVTLGMSVLSDDQKAELHRATLEVLRRTGVRVIVPEVQEILAKAGCWVDGDRVRIPSHLVEWAIRVAPHRVVLCDRDGDPAMYLEGRKSYYGTGSDTPFLIDAYTGERRKAVLADVANVSLLVDALPNIDFVMCMGIASDVTESISDLYHFEAMVSNTTKPIIYTAWNRQNLEEIVEMAEAVAGGAEALQRNPFFALYSEPIAPLTHATESCEKLLYICEKGLPVVYTPGLITGATSPVTRAGAVVQANAELLSGLLICQLIREGTPVVAGAGGMMTMDMSTTLSSYGAPEFMLDWCALCEMGHYYDLPIFGFAGSSDAKTFDQQAGIEGALWVLIGALSGGNLIHDMGYVESGLTTSYEMLVSMNEVVGLAKRFVGGVAITGETLALDVIDRVGPGGHFLAEKHTVQHFRENWRSTLFDRDNREVWESGGAFTMGDRATAQVQEILKSHKPAPLGEPEAAKLAAIIERAEERVRKNRG